MEKLQQWPKIKEIVGSALERPPAERSAYLDQACSNDSELRAEVESLLSAYHDTRGLPPSPWQDATIDSGDQLKVIGPYRLLKELGFGGMGQVWLAEQTEPVQRQVALKLIRAGMYDAGTVQRFKAERQALAIMDHPAIAKVFDAGTTPVGQPYFVMEYVDGLTITDYCDTKRLSIRERLELFIRVCEGVQHAHQKAIIHRDLKPSNIIVVEVDGKPMPRIIDFGLAKAAVPLTPGQTQMTQMGAFLGTPGYMSPEQADLGSDIDTRTDVYSLGVILYELLSGLLPFDTNDLQKHPEDFVRRLRENDPVRPSTKLSTNRETASGNAAGRGTDVAQLIAQLRGDLDWIALKALERDRERRYSSPLALAADLQNYLDDQPVTACPASLGYRARKYARRHAAGIAVVAGAMVLLIVFAITQAIQLRRVTRERDRADRISGFMTSMFTLPDPSEARGSAITAREILDRSAKDIDASLNSDPELQAKMMYTMALTYRGLGLYPRAQDLQERALLIQRRDLGVGNRDTLRSMNNLSGVLRDEGHDPEAEKVSREALETSRRVLGQRDPDTLRLMVNLGSALYQQGHFEEAEKLFRESLEIQRVILGPEHQDTIGSMNDLAAAYYQEARYAEAEKLHRESLEVRRRVLGPDHPDTLTAMMNLANTLNQENRFSEAETLTREALEIQRRIVGSEHPDTLLTRSVLATSLKGRGDYAGAEKLRRQNLEIQRRMLGPAHPDTLLNLGALALDLSHEQRYEEAEKLFRERVELAVSSKRPELVALAWYDFACGMALAGRRGEAFLYLQRAIDGGHQEPADIAADDDLKSLHDDPRFEVTLTRARNKLTAIKQ